MARPDDSARPLPPVIGFSIAIAILYFARELLIPLAFALFIAFLLSPIVKRLEGWRVPRMPATMIVFALASVLVAVLGWLVATQLRQVVQGLPQYSDNVRRKIGALQGQSNGLSDIFSSIDEMGKQVSVAPRSSVPQTTQAAPLSVQIVEQHSLIQAVRDYAGTILKPLGNAVLIVVFTIFMLLDRENLRNRLLRLMGQQKLQATTKAMDDAGQRVSRYVLMQFAVNAGFGAVIALGLTLIGVQSALLWGVLGVFLRFLPYVGPLIAGTMPFALAVAMSDGWRMPLLVFALFSVTELIVGNFVEPLLYGVHTGLSAVAILVSAVFWTVIWGPVGLILSTPLTVCLSVMGRYSPQLEYLNIVLGDEQVLPPDVIFYQRLLALDQYDALNVLEGLSKDKPLITVFDEIVIPALAMAERDRQTGELDAKREDFIVKSIHEFVTELQEADASQRGVRPVRQTRVFCIPAHDAADEIAAAMCAHFLGQLGFPAIAFPVTEAPGQLIASLGAQAEDVICISAVPPFATSNARKVAKDVREAGSPAVLVAGLWNYSSASAARMDRLRTSLGVIVATSLVDAVARVVAVENRTA